MKSDFSALEEDAHQAQELGIYFSQCSYAFFLNSSSRVAGGLT